MTEKQELVDVLPGIPLFTALPGGPSFLELELLGTNQIWCKGGSCAP